MTKNKFYIIFLLSLIIIAIIGTVAFAKIIKTTPYKPLEVAKKLEASLKEKKLKIGSEIFIRIFKESSEFEVWIKGSDDVFHLYKNYPICYFSGELGPKLKEGDGQAPEGFYQVKKSQMNPNSSYHLSFNLGFPNRYDRSHKRTGSYLMVHGNCVSIGCYAMTDSKIEEIYILADYALKNGQSAFEVHAFPFRMNNDNMKLHEKSKWYSFWQNLKEGYDYFEENKKLPQIVVKNKKYLVK